MKLEALKFVQGAVARKDYVPAMTHFVIRDSTVRAFNGTMALSSPIDSDMVCAPKAGPLVRAIASCNDVVTLDLTKANRLRVQSGRFKAFIDCLEVSDLPVQVPTGEPVEVEGQALLDAFKVLAPFVGNDATRPWTNGILLAGDSAYATNNICLLQYWLGVQVPFTVNVPELAIKEVVRIGEPPTGVQLDEHSITFHYADGRWIKSQLYSLAWPEMVPKLLNAECSPVAVPEGFFEGLDLLKGFLGNSRHVYFQDGELRTDPAEGLGAQYAVDGLHHEGVYLLPMLQLLQGVADKIDFTLYPRPAMFHGGRVRGAITGLRP